ncbi:P-type conjugative transfer protein TrbJ [Azohydromonas caseinilytica]|uniref:P-type conjugative transfer protein TrbJ n=1 Tax=Azohydromonas caseinilytica TaxID=2728836 RepID=A0A848FBY9_9BURK|nr:P-type conjugative transfer protein TrbJ [Azohydromonas caseinilytica]NML17014.1 P-type conjugative transfer protein TrbJ [Azohydromonas caseinilytica]
MSKLTSIGAAMALAFATVIPAHAQGIPVGDGITQIQSTINAQEGIKQTMKQVEEYRTQLQQYAQQLKDAAAPAAYIWDQATRVMDQLRGAIDTLAFYKRQMGDINFYLRQFNDVHDYRDSPCFNGNGCTQAQRDQEHEREAALLGSQKRANEAAIRAVDQQQDALVADAKRLEQLQRNAQSAQGQREAIDAATQVAAQQSHQLLQIRGILISQNTALVTRQQALTDREAREAVAGAEFRRGTFTPSPKKEW